MEGLFGILIVIAGIWGIQFLLSAGAGATRAAYRTATGKGSWKDNVDLEIRGMGPFETRLRHTKIGEEAGGMDAYAVEIRGLMPVTKQTKIAFLTSLVDCTEEGGQPVISHLDQFQEPGNITYQNLLNAGTVGPTEGVPAWTQVALVVPDLLQPPVSGTRKIAVMVRVIDADKPPEVILGFVRGTRQSVLHTAQESFTHVFNEKGYREVAENRDQARALAITMAVAVAMADGSLDDREGEVIKEWIARHLAMLEGDELANEKERLNESFREAYRNAVEGTLSLSRVTEEMRELDEEPQNYEAIELCYEVMAADGVADKGELETIHNIASALGIDYEEMQKIQDRKVLELDTSIDTASPEELLGIGSDWSPAEVRQYLTEQYRKWNARLNTLPEGEERKNAQRMLDQISAARKKYSSDAK